MIGWYDNLNIILIKTQNVSDTQSMGQSNLICYLADFAYKISLFKKLQDWVICYLFCIEKDSSYQCRFDR